MGAKEHYKGGNWNKIRLHNMRILNSASGHLSDSFKVEFRIENEL
jgi:hypothetical protein